MIYYLLLLIPLIFITNSFLKKKKILLNFTGQEHQIYMQKDQVPLSGGLFIFIFFLSGYNFFDIELIIFVSIFYFFGLTVDLNINKSPSVRFLFQIFFLIFFVIHFDLSIKDVRMSELNILLKNFYFNTFFVLFCLLVFVNGSNFIDGNNGLAIGYFIIIFLSILYLNLSKDIGYDLSVLIFFLILLAILLIFNLKNKLYLGDSGIYILSIYSSLLLINFTQSNEEISPYFIVNLLWYPSFEILFSFIRKIIFKFSPMKPDNLHLHQLIFYLYNTKLNLDNSQRNSFVGISINFYNLMIICLALNNVSDTKLQIVYLIFSIFTYIVFYIYLYNFKKYQNNNLK